MVSRSQFQQFPAMCSTRFMHLGSGVKHQVSVIIILTYKEDSGVHRMDESVDIQVHPDDLEALGWHLRVSVISGLEKILQESR